MKDWKPFPQDQEKTKLSAFTSSQHCIEGSSQGNYSRKRIKDIKIGKEEIKQFLFTDDIILYIKSANKSTGKWLKLISKFSKIADNIQKLTIFIQ